MRTPHGASLAPNPLGAAKARIPMGVELVPRVMRP